MYSGECETWTFSLKASSLGNGSAAALPVQQSPKHAVHVHASAEGAFTRAGPYTLQTPDPIFLQTHQCVQGLLLVPALVFRYVSLTDSTFTFP